MALRYSAMASSNWFLASSAIAEVVVGQCELGIEVDGLAEFGDGLVQLVLGLQCDAEVVVGTVGVWGRVSMALRNSAMASSNWFLS